VTWTDVHQKAFESLKDKLINHPVLIWPDFSKPFTIISDSSGVAIGGVLAQDQGKGLQPVAFKSRKNATSRNQIPGA
jgi:hypothetical protein